jgi:hypothetical protein
MAVVADDVHFRHPLPGPHRPLMFVPRVRIILQVRFLPPVCIHLLQSFCRRPFPRPDRFRSLIRESELFVRPFGLAITYRCVFRLVRPRELKLVVSVLIRHPLAIGSIFCGRRLFVPSLFL